MRRPSSLILIPLTCPRCGGDLPAAQEDVAFACPACRSGSELVDQRLRTVPLLGPRQPAPPRAIHLPFWQFTGGVRVPAFNTAEVLSLTRRLSGRALDLQEGPAAGFRGATLGRREAASVAVFLALSPEPPPVKAALLALPYLDEGNHLLDLSTGALLYREALDRPDRWLPSDTA